MKQLDMDMFTVTEKDGLRLILPQRSNVLSNDGWNKDNLWLRSRVESIETGELVSQGFGKFLNLGQGSDVLRIDAATILEAIRNKEPVVATLKYDGSCLIRSVHQNKVMFRTRGSMQYTYHDDAEKEMGIFLDKYPRLLDTAWQADKSLLFEWFTPAFQIIIKYDEADLRLLGAVDHNEMQYLKMSDLEPIANECGITLTEYHTIDSIEDWHDFYQKTLSRIDVEGFVLRLNQQQDLVKIKSESYILRHSVKSNMSFKSMVSFWLENGQDDTYTATLRRLGELYDEEIVMYALPFVDNLFVAVDGWKATLNDVNNVVASNRDLTRKDFAIKMQAFYKETPLLFSLAMQLWQGKEISERMISNFMMTFDKEIKGQFSS